MGRGITDRLQLEALGLGLAHQDREAVLKAQGREHLQPELAAVGQARVLPDLLGGPGPRQRRRLLEDRRPGRAAVLHVAIQPTMAQAVVQQTGAAETEAALHLQARVAFNLLGQQFAEDQLLGEILRADPHHVAGLKVRQHQAEHSGEAQGGQAGLEPAAGAGPLAAEPAGGPGEAALQGPQAGISRQGDGRRRQRTGQNLAVVHRGNAAEDEHPQAAGADGGGNGGHTDTDHRGHPQAGHRHRQGQRRFDVAQHLGLGEPQGLARLLQPGRHLGQTGEEAAQQGQQRIQGERHHRRRRADAAEQGHGEQQAEDRQAGDGLHRIGQGEHRRGPTGPAMEGQAERQGDQHRQSDGDRHQQQMFAAALQDFDRQVHGRSPDNVVHGMDIDAIQRGGPALGAGQSEAALRP